MITLTHLYSAEEKRQHVVEIIRAIESDSEDEMSGIWMYRWIA
jgi:hypothetical protein